VKRDLSYLGEFHASSADEETFLLIELGSGPGSGIHLPISFSSIEYLLRQLPLRSSRQSMNATVMFARRRVPEEVHL
jgi:hypothetical protein